MTLKPLTYEEGRILGFMSVDGHFQPNQEDLEILQRLDVNHLAEVGGHHPYIRNAPDIICRNPRCEFNQRRTYFDTVLLLPPFPVNGEDEFWYEFQGACMTFCFGLCRFCGTVIVFNVA